MKNIQMVYQRFLFEGGQEPGGASLQHHHAVPVHPDTINTNEFVMVEFVPPCVIAVTMAAASAF